MDIQITTKKSDGVERLLQVSVPAETVRAAEDKAARRYASSARLPGFRAGKAPPAVVRKRFGDAIRQEALEAVVQEAYKEVLEREKLTPAAQPHVHDVKFEDGKPLVFELHLELRPELELARLNGFRVTRKPPLVTDEQVREQIDQVRDQRASWTPVDDRPREGDLVTVHLAMAEEGGTIPEGQPYTITLGSGQAIAGIEDVIMTLSKGETVERPVRWPDDFPDEAQRGQMKTVRVSLDEVKRKELPALDDAFAREVGDFDSLDGLMKTVRADLQHTAERESEADVRQKLLDEVIGANAFEVPPSWVQRVVGAYLEMYQVPAEEHERFGRELRPMAERQVRRDLVVDAIAERERLSASEADVDAKVAEMAAARGTDAGKLYAALQRAGRLREIERSVTEDRVFAWLRERNTIDER